MRRLLRKSLVVALSAQLVEGVQVLVLLLCIHRHEKARLLTFIDPVDLEHLEAGRPDELVQLGEHLPSCVLLKVLCNRASLNDHSEKVEIITLVFI